MHEVVVEQFNKFKTIDETKQTLECVASVSVTEEDSSRASEAEKDKDEGDLTEKTTGAAVGGSVLVAAAVEKAELMQIEAESATHPNNNHRKGKGEEEEDVTMQEAGEAAGTTARGAAAAAAAVDVGEVANDKKTKGKREASEAVPSSTEKRIEGGQGKGSSSSSSNGKNSVKAGGGGVDHKNDAKRKSDSVVAAAGGSATVKNAKTNGGNSSTSAPPPPPVMKGTLSYELDQRGGRHLIRGMWNYENSNLFPAQRFELVRNLAQSEDPTILPVDGVFHGSFSLAYIHTTSKGKQKERSKVISESGVEVKFSKVEGSNNEYQVDGKGTNQFGVFRINGKATPSTHEGDPTFNIVFRKQYEPGPPSANNADSATSKKQKQDKKADKSASANVADHGETEGPLPPPSQSFPSGVVCLRGKLYKEESQDLGMAEVVHRINGMWASGLDLILADPQNVQGNCNRFEYEHKSSVPSNAFPVSGRYSGWFNLKNEDGTSTPIMERDVTIRFKKNNAGHHNVEGRGSNVFGKYSITGTLTMDNVITIFRHFQARKLKNARANVAASNVNSTGAPPGGAQARKPAAPIVPGPEPKLKLGDVVIPGDTGDPSIPLPPIEPPANSTYSAVSRGVLKVNEDGSHSCQGKWAVARQHLDTNGPTSAFNFRLEAHFAAAAKELQGPNAIAGEFPLDSAMYKGSFQMKKGATRYTKIVDHQIVMRFRVNTNGKGSYNVYGKGVNEIGEFNLLGTMVIPNKNGGQVELYRMYPPALLNHAKAMTATASVAPGLSAGASAAPVVVVPPPALPVMSSSACPLPARPPTIPSSVVVPDMAGVAGLAPGIAPVAQLAVRPTVADQIPPPRRESTRLVKLPSRLEDDDPTAQLSRTMDKCHQILKFIREKDVDAGAYFSEPVDPVALGIPTYHQVIKEPMDLRTVHRRMDANEIRSPEEFARLVRLVFENAMTFNVDPAHSVHQIARNLLIQFNQKYRDVERMVQNIRRQQGISEEEKGKKKKDEKKRKRGAAADSPEEVKSLKRRRLEEAVAMNAANVSALTAIHNAAPPVNSISTPVTRQEFNMLLQMMEQLQRQVVQTHTALAELCPGDENDAMSSSGVVGNQNAAAAVNGGSATIPAPAQAAPATAPEKTEKKKPKRKSTAKTKKDEAVAAAVPKAAKAAKPASTPPAPAPAPPPDDSNKPLTLDEQELLTETINDLPSDHLVGVIQIIREAAPVGADEDEIDLEIDQLAVSTQRKLLRHVSKFVKKTKTKTKKKPPKGKDTASQPKSKADTPPSGSSSKKNKAPPAPAAAKPKPKPKPKEKPVAAADSFFPFGGRGGGGDSDTESDQDDGAANKQQQPPPGGKVFNPSGAAAASKNKGNDFKLNGGLSALQGDDDDDDDDDDDEGIAGNWNFGGTTGAGAGDSTKDGVDDDGEDDDDDSDDDAWRGAREAAAVQKARDKERMAREEKRKAEAEQLKEKRLADAAAKGQEILAQREEEDARAKREREDKEKEEAKIARDKAQKQLAGVEQVLDLDAQRNLMQQYEQTYLDKDLGSASPSSDFGF